MIRLRFSSKNFIARAIALFVLVSSESSATEKILLVEPYLHTNGVHAGEQFQVALVVQLQDDWHINSNQTKNEFTIPTKVIMPESGDYTIQSISFPPTITKQFAFTSEPIAVFEGRFVIFLTGKLSSKTNKDVRLSGKLTYQGCNNQVCLPPDESIFELVIPVLSKDQPILFQNETYFAEFSSSSGLAAKGIDVEKSVTEKGYLLTFLLIFLGGLGLNLTPCVYPLIPITVSYFGSQTIGRAWHRLLMAIIFVLGMAIVNSLLGTLAALSGNLIGTALANPIVLIILAVIMLALALAMFGVYEFRLPNWLMNLSGVTQAGYLGSLLMGLTMGIVAAPCIGPFVLGLLTYVATTGKAWFGFLMFFTLSLGLGLPFIILAFFSSSIQKLPRSGEWMVGVRALFGLILIGMALYFILPLIPLNLRKSIFPFYSLLSGIYLILINRSGVDSKAFTFVKNLVGIVLIIVGVWFAKPSEQAISGMEWQSFTAEKFEQARQSGKPIILDFYADWCIPCKELDQLTFTDPEVVRLSTAFVLFKIDLTTGGNAITQPLQQRFAVKGVPTIIFIDRNGRELTNLRLVGFEKANQFSARLQKALE